MPDSAGDFRALQYEFTAHIRDPSRNPAPAGIEDRRLAIYRELLYNNVEGFMATSFPVLRSILPDSRWHAMIRAYFADHRARTPYFPKLAREFLHYLADKDADADEPPFLRELAHYEWLEIETMMDKREIDDEPVDATIGCLDGMPVLNPIARVQSYAYPVHRIGPDFQPQEPPAQPTYLVVYRDRNDDVRFMELNPMTARLIELIANAALESGRAMLAQIAAELNHPDPAVVMAGGDQILQELHTRGVLIGARR